MKRTELEKMFAMEDEHFWFVGKRLCIDAVLRGDKHPSYRRILDVGCGTGGTSVFMGKYGTVIGLEHDDYAYRRAKSRNLEVIKGTANTLPFNNASFDMVTLLDVLYHKNIPTVERAIQEASRVLVSGGTILITDSALPMLWSKHDEIMEGKRRFMIPELENLLRENGFIIKRSSYYFFFLFPILLIKRKILDPIKREYSADVGKLPTWLNMCCILVMRAESFLLRYVAFPYGSSLILYAKKQS